MRRLLGLLLAVALCASPAAAQFAGGPDVRPHSPRLFTNRNAVYYGGTGTSRTYDPGVSQVTLDSMTVTIPAGQVSRVFEVTASYVADMTNVHGVRGAIYLDGAIIGTNRTQAWAVPSSGNVEGSFSTFGPIPVTIPGDGASHVLTLSVANSGASGNLTFYQRWIIARQIN